MINQPIFLLTWLAQAWPDLLCQNLTLSRFDLTKIFLCFCESFKIFPKISDTFLRLSLYYLSLNSFSDVTCPDLTWLVQTSSDLIGPYHQLKFVRAFCESLREISQKMSHQLSLSTNQQTRFYRYRVFFVRDTKSHRRYLVKYFSLFLRVPSIFFPGYLMSF